MRLPDIPKYVLLVTSMVLGMYLSNIQAAIDPVEFSNPREEARYKNLIDQLRCLVCQNQTLADSNAELAQDLRREVYGMIKSGKTDDEITDFLVARYSDFVLYRPPVKSTTFLLWFLPGILAVLALVFVVVLIKKRSSDTTAPIIDADVEDRINKLVGPK